MLGCGTPLWPMSMPWAVPRHPEPQASGLWWELPLLFRPMYVDFHPLYLPSPKPTNNPGPEVQLVTLQPTSDQGSFKPGITSSPDTVFHPVLPMQTTQFFSCTFHSWFQYFTCLNSWFHMTETQLN